MRPIDNDIAAALGFQGQELCSLLLRLAPEVLVTKDNALYSNIQLVVAALDRNCVLIPLDPRAPASFTRRPGSTPRLSYRPAVSTAVADDTDHGDADDLRPIEAEVVEEERPRRPARDEQPRRPGKRARRQAE